MNSPATNIEPLTPVTFESVVNGFYQDVYRFAMSLTRNEADAVDLTQETFLRYAKKRDTIRDPSKTKSWLFRTTKNEFLNHARKRKNRTHVDIDEPAVVSDLPATEPSAARSFDSQLALDALQQVDETYRIALAMFYMNGLSYREIAEALEVPIGTVMSRISRAKTQLRAAMQDPTPPLSQT